MEIAGNYCFLLHNCCCISDVFSDAQGNRMPGASNCCYTFADPWLYTIIILEQLLNMILLECHRFFFQYLYVCMFLCCLYKVTGGICGFVQLWWKLWRSRSLQHPGISVNGVRQLKSNILWAAVALCNPQSTCSCPDNGIKSFISNVDKEH